MFPWPYRLINSLVSPKYMVYCLPRSAKRDSMLFVDTADESGRDRRCASSRRLLTGGCLVFGGFRFTVASGGGFGTDTSVGIAHQINLFLSWMFMNFVSSKCSAQTTQFLYRYPSDCCIKSLRLRFRTHLFDLCRIQERKMFKKAV